MALRKSGSTSSGLSIAPLANAEDDNSCECSDSGTYYSSTLIRNANSRHTQPTVLTLLTGNNGGSGSVATTADSVDSGTFTTPSIVSSLSVSTQLSDLTCVTSTSSGVASTSQIASSYENIHGDDIKHASDEDTDEEDNDIEAGFGERSSSSDGENSSSKMSHTKSSTLARENNANTAPGGGGLSRHRSLEALVNSFDERLNAALGDMTCDVKPISTEHGGSRMLENNHNISTQEELVSDDPMWLHLTQPEAVIARRLNESIDWSQTVVREQILLPAPRGAHRCSAADDVEGCKNQQSNGRKEDEDDGFAELYDMHSLSGLYESDGSAHRNGEIVREDKLQTADEVIEEINQIMSENTSSTTQNQIGTSSKSYMDSYNLTFDNYEDENNRVNHNNSSANAETSCSAAVANVLSEIEEKLKSMPIPLYEDKLKDLSIPDLLELMADLDKLTQQFSEILVHELALRDELQDCHILKQFEKEIKNTFITLVLRVQNQRKESENAERVQRRRRSAAAAAAAASRLRSPTTLHPQQQPASSPFFSPTSTLAAALHSPVLSSWSSSILNSPLSALVPGSLSASTTKLAAATTPTTSLSTAAAAATTLSSSSSSLALRYLSTQIPYQPGGAATSLRHLQAMIKILRAMSENSPTTTTLLTDYILNVLCPKE